MIIRTPAPGDLPVLRAIERAAGEPFRGLGMARIADDEPPSLAELTRYRQTGRALAAYEAAGGAEGEAGRSAICSGTRSTAASTSSRCRYTPPTPTTASAGPSSSGPAGRTRRPG